MICCDELYVAAATRAGHADRDGAADGDGGGALARLPQQCGGTLAPASGEFYDVYAPVDS